MRALAAILGVLVLGACVPAGQVQRLQSSTTAETPAPLYVPGPPHPFPAGRPNIEMTRDFMDLGFSMESGRPISRFSRFEGPISVTINGPAPIQASQDLDRLVARLRTEARIDITHVTGPVPEGQNAITVQFLPRRQMQSVVPAAACFVVPNVDDWAGFVANRRSAAIDWTQVVLRHRVAVFIPSDTTPQEVRDCLHEEISQGMGPLNDLFRLSDSIYNDDNFQTTLTGFDMLLLRIWYAPELHPGMTPDQISARLPTLYNRFNPAGRRLAGRQAGITPRAWQQAIEQALTSDGGTSRRRAGAARALSLARAQGWTDSRLALSLMLSARLAPPEDGQVALDALLQALQIYRATPGGEVHAAHIDMHLAVQALANGQTDTVLDLTARAIPVAERTENAAFLASLQLIHAEALQTQGRDAEAQRLRVDSMAAARYGFGSEDAVRARMDEIARIGSAAHRLARL